MADHRDPLAGRQLTDLLTMAHRSIVAEFTAELTAAGYDDLNPVHSRAFQVLQASGGCTGRELGEALGVTPQVAAQTVKELEQRGYLRSTPHPHGGRRVRVVLTDKALQHLRASGYVQARLEGRLAGRIGGGGLEELRSRLAEVIRAGAEAPPPAS